MRKKPELLIPANNPEVLRCAVNFGADAVYIGGEAFSLRAKAKNFTQEEMAESIRFAHEHGVRVHVTANILAPVIERLAAEGAADRFIKEGGVFVSSGIIDTKVPDVVRAFRENPAWTKVSVNYLGEWAAVSAVRTPSLETWEISSLFVGFHSNFASLSAVL